MKVLMLNGSPRVGGNTSIALAEMEHVFAQEGVAFETIQVGQKDIRGCIACGKCEHSCPQHLPIRKLLREVAAEFEKPTD